MCACAFLDFQFDSHAKDKCILMHCLQYIPKKFVKHVSYVVLRYVNRISSVELAR